MNSAFLHDGDAIEFFDTLLEASTEYSIIGKGLDGTILLWNEGARRHYGYAAEEVVGKANADLLHTPEDVAAGLPLEMRQGHRRQRPSGAGRSGHQRVHAGHEP